MLYFLFVRFGMKYFPCCLTRDVQCLYPFPGQEKTRSGTEVRAL
jgi:hypothetical protein